MDLVNVSVFMKEGGREREEEDDEDKKKGERDLVTPTRSNLERAYSPRTHYPDFYL